MADILKIASEQQLIKKKNQTLKLAQMDEMCRKTFRTEAS